ncbi:unnamed protein product [Eruca vesicaria subsp. sativa]|uniref:Leucine-rich repeat-containing N-terminal plant-type domain-containing protein n=1 Tax=Eruca vesicaria subsp. sativa TaxID=29727 RepID=A0ABC8IZS4_ERUVS|nr:unnamed protein product [Eruca vesicaria subsp. sativa]
MNSSSLFIFAACIFLYFLNPTRAATCHPDDEAGLLAFKSGITEDPSGILSTWKKGTDCCSWNSIFCFNKRVYRIFIEIPFDSDGSRNFLSGTISPSLAKLQHLSDITLVNLKNVTGPSPQFLFQLPKLDNLILDSVGLSGPLPVKKIGSLIKLTGFQIPGNRFTGPFPNSLSKLTRLQYVDISWNDISGSPVRFLNQAENLWEFHATGNKLRFDFGKVKIPERLDKLVLSTNLIYGRVPPSVASLEELNVRDNHLCGELPKLPPGRFYTSDFEGNDCLCGFPLPPCKA